jgi:aerobic carbon-monoxide dehydrogenase medium subunit
MPRFVEPTSVAEASAVLAADAWGARAIAGGTALVLMMRQGLANPDTLVSLGRLPELTGIGPEGPDLLRIGARTTLTDVAASPLVRRAAPSLAYACSRVGNVRVRNVATLGGNVAEADYASDPPAVLVALDASCRVTGPAGTRTVPVRDLVAGFYTTTLEPGEIVTDVLVPGPGPVDRRSSYQKYLSRSSEDRPCVGVAATADLAGGEVTRLTVVVGAVAGVPQRRDEIAVRAVGTRLEPDVRADIARAYAAAIDPMEDGRGSAWYRTRMIEVFVRRALDDLARS